MKTEKLSLDNSNKFGKGDILQGRVVKQQEDSNKVTIKLTNGMEIEAEINDDVNLKGGILKFQVSEFKDNKLFLKVINTNTEGVMGNVKSNIDEIMNFILKEGLKKEDYDMIKQMIKFNIPLTKENITALKSILEFSNKMNTNPKEIDNFINAYLSSKNISINDPKGMEVANKLYEFFKTFSTVKSDEIMTLLENGLDFTKENLEGINKLFNNGDNIEKVIKNINDDIIKSIINNDEDFNIDNKSEKINNTALKNIVEGEKNSDNETLNENRFISATIVKDKASISNVRSNFTINILDNNYISDEEALKIIEFIKSSGKENIDKESIKEFINKEIGKEVAISEKEIKLIDKLINKEFISEKDINIIKGMFSNIEGKQQIISKELNSNDIKENIANISKSLAENIEEKSEISKETIRSIIANLKDSKDNSSQILNIMKNSINDLKLYNKISNQYYCLDVPVKFNENEYPCKLIIKDDRKDGKTIDSNNFKVAISVKTTKIGTVDALLDVKNKNIDVELKCNNKYIKLFEISKNKLKDIIEASGFTVKIKVVEKVEELNLTSCREFFNENNVAALDIKV